MNKQLRCSRVQSMCRSGTVNSMSGDRGLLDSYPRLRKSGTAGLTRVRFVKKIRMLAQSTWRMTSQAEMTQKLHIPAVYVIQNQSIHTRRFAASLGDAAIARHSPESGSWPPHEKCTGDATAASGKLRKR